MNRRDDLQPMKNNKQWKNQKGMTGIGIAMILGLLAFVVLIALRLFPVYMEHFDVTSHLSQLGEDSRVKNMTNDEILVTLQKRFRIDRVQSVKDEHVFIERSNDGSVIVAIEYEVRTAGIANVEMIVSFSDEVKIN